MLYNKNPDAQKCFGQLYTIDDEEANALRLGFIKHITPDKKVKLSSNKIQNILTFTFFIYIDHEIPE